jgi:hypothetical protein
MYRKERRWWSGREKTIEYPKDLPGKYSLNRHETITAIRIYNKFYDGLHSEAKISSGAWGIDTSKSSCRRVGTRGSSTWCRSSAVKTIPSLLDHLFSVRKLNNK